MSKDSDSRLIQRDNLQRAIETHANALCALLTVTVAVSSSRMVPIAKLRSVERRLSQMRESLVTTFDGPDDEGKG